MRNFNGIPLARNIAVGNVAQNAIGANVTVLRTVLVPGCRVGDFVLIRYDTAPDIGAACCGAYCAVAGTVTTVWINTTAGALPAGAGGLNYSVLCFPQD